jgi:hypothetical protein
VGETEIGLGSCEDRMIEEREDVSIIYVVLMTAVILTLVVLFGIRSRYAANPVRHGRHDGAQSAMRSLMAREKMRR